MNNESTYLEKKTRIPMSNADEEISIWSLDLNIFQLTTKISTGMTLPPQP